MRGKPMKHEFDNRPKAGIHRLSKAEVVTLQDWRDEIDEGRTRRDKAIETIRQSNRLALIAERQAHEDDRAALEHASEALRNPEPTWLAWLKAPARVLRDIYRMIKGKR